MSLRDSVLTDVPDDQRAMIENDFRAEGAAVTATKQANGMWTLRAVFPAAAATSPVARTAGAVAGSAIPAAAPAPAANAAAQRLGKLSEKYETGGRGPGTVSTGIGDAGGVSYGSYQMTSKGGGTVGKFVSHPEFPWRAEFLGLVPGSGPFTEKWKALANAQPRPFQLAQHSFIRRTHFDPLVDRLRADEDLDVRSRSRTLQDVVWSTAVQHGPASRIVQNALAVLRATGIADFDADGFDQALIRAIYSERGRRSASGALAHFANNSPEVQNGVAKRFVDELQDALRSLADEG